VGFRFQRRKSILPGVRLNVGKRGPSGVRLGGRGAGVTVGRRGVTATVSLLGTGLSYIFRRKR
jgi:Protein of unknown function (DUF4236)